MTKPDDLVEMEAIDLVEWETDQHTPQANDAKLKALIRQTTSVPVEPEPPPGPRKTATFARVVAKPAAPVAAPVQRIPHAVREPAAPQPTRSPRALTPAVGTPRPRPPTNAEHVVRIPSESPTRADASPVRPQRAEGSAALPKRTEGSAALPKRTEGAAALPKRTEGSASLPKRTEGSASLPKHVEGSSSKAIEAAAPAASTVARSRSTADAPAPRSRSGSNAGTPSVEGYAAWPMASAEPRPAEVPSPTAREPSRPSSPRTSPAQAVVPLATQESPAIGTTPASIVAPSERAPDALATRPQQRSRRTLWIAGGAAAVVAIAAIAIVAGSRGATPAPVATADAPAPPTPAAIAQPKASPASATKAPAASAGTDAHAAIEASADATATTGARPSLPGRSTAKPPAAGTVRRVTRPANGGVEVARRSTPRPATDTIAKIRSAYATGNQRLFAGDSAGAIAAYEQTLALAPSYAAGHRGLGLAYAQAGDKRRALAAFKAYVKLAPRAKDVPLIQKRIAALGK